MCMYCNSQVPRDGIVGVGKSDPGEMVVRIAIAWKSAPIKVVPWGESALPMQTCKRWAAAAVMDAQVLMEMVVVVVACEV